VIEKVEIKPAVEDSIFQCGASAATDSTATAAKTDAKDAAKDAKPAGVKDASR